MIFDVLKKMKLITKIPEVVRPIINPNPFGGTIFFPLPVFFSLKKLLKKNMTWIFLTFCFFRFCS